MHQTNEKIKLNYSREEPIGDAIVACFILAFFKPSSGTDFTILLFVTAVWIQPLIPASPPTYSSAAWSYKKGQKSQLGMWHTSVCDLSILSWAPDLQAANVSFLMNANCILPVFFFSDFSSLRQSLCSLTTWTFRIPITGWIVNDSNGISSRGRGQQNCLQDDLPAFSSPFQIIA